MKHWATRLFWNKQSEKMFYFIEIFVIAKLYVVLTTLLASINGDPEPQETTQPPPNHH